MTCKNTLHVVKCCPKGQHFPAINDDLYKVQIVISATGSRAELSIFINMRRSRGALNDGGATGKKRGGGSGNNRGVGGGGVSKICVKQFWVSDAISLLAHYL